MVTRLVSGGADPLKPRLFLLYFAAFPSAIKQVRRKSLRLVIIHKDRPLFFFFHLKCIDAMQPMKRVEVDLYKSRALVCSVHCYILNALNSAWQIADIQ